MCKELEKLNDLVLFRQPIVDAEKVLSGYEILLRLNAGEELVSPVLFIEEFEQSGNISQVDIYVATTALNGIALRDEKDLFYNINVSVKTLESAKATACLINHLTWNQQKLKDNNISVTFEITETAKVTQVDDFIENIHKLQSAGAKIALDDFGAGYNSFILAGLIEPDTIKFSPEFMQYAHVEKVVRVADAIIRLAKNGNTRTVAEGVETEEMFQKALKLNVCFCQGYLFGRPERFIG